jgi:hypothetical protein
VRLYHVSDQAETILEWGFQDGSSFLRAGRMHRGVWLFDRPVEAGEEISDDVRTIVVDIPEDVALRHEWLEEATEYRRFLIPASVLNRYLKRG